MGLPTEFTPKSFWAKKEGTTGMIVAAGAIVGGGLLLFKLLPFIIVLLSNAIHAAILAIVLAVGTYTIVHYKTLLSYMYKSVMRAITSIFVTIDPIGIIKNYIKSLKEKLEDVDAQIAKLRGNLVMLKRDIDENEVQKQKSLRMAKLAKDQGGESYQMTARLAIRKAGRAEQSNVSFKEAYQKLEGLYRALNKIKEVSGYMVQDLEDEVEQKIKERDRILAAHKAMQSAMKVFKPESDEKQLFDMALERMAEDVALKVGEIDSWLEVSENFTNGMDLENKVMEGKGWDLLEAWEKKDSKILGSKKQLYLEQAKDEGNLLNLDNPVEMEKPPRENQFSGLFN